MTLKRAIGSAGIVVLACVTLLAIQGPGQGTLNAAGGVQDQAGAAGRGRAGGAAPAVNPGTLITGAWGAEPLPLDPRGWGWMTQSYVSAGYKRPFWNKAKELL